MPHAVAFTDASYRVVQRFRKQRLPGTVARMVRDSIQQGGGVVAQKERQRCENQSFILCDRVDVTRPDLECCVSLQGVESGGIS